MLYLWQWFGSAVGVVSNTCLQMPCVLVSQTPGTLVCVLLPQQHVLQVYFSLHYSHNMLIVHKGYFPHLFQVSLNMEKG